jgi:hypothetical protein
MSLSTKGQRLTTPVAEKAIGPKRRLFYWTWLAALGCFILVGGTGPGRQYCSAVARRRFWLARTIGLFRPESRCPLTLLDKHSPPANN